MDKSNSVFDHLEASRHRKGAGLLVLVDPDKLPLAHLAGFCHRCQAAGVDGYLVGGSLLHNVHFEEYVEAMKQAADLPVIGFPGSLGQISASLDAILYLSVVSSRNPEYLFGQHVQAAPLLRALELETISTAYMLFESGLVTTAQYMSSSMPLPREKPEIAAATALAAEMMGMRVVYADGGSGARLPVPLAAVRAIKETCSIPLIVGGGLRSPEMVEERVQAGADYIVVGNVLEERGDGVFLAEIAAATRASTLLN